MSFPAFLYRLIKIKAETAQINKIEKSLNSLLFQDKIKMLLFSQQGHVKNSQCDTQDFIWE